MTGALELVEGREQSCKDAGAVPGISLTRPPGGGYDDGWTTISELPSGSRSQNIGGTGSP
jgi:hypothetical protein